MRGERSDRRRSNVERKKARDKILAYLVEHQNELLVGSRHEHCLLHLGTSAAEGIPSIQHLKNNV